MTSSTQTLTYSQALQLAFQHHQAGNLSQAEAIYRQMLLVTPQPSELLHLLGVIAAQRQQFAEAAELINQAIALDNTVANFYSSLGGALSGQGQWAEALANFNQALALDPNHLETHYNLGNLLRHQQQWAPAAEHYRRYLALNPNDATVHQSLGSVLLSQGQISAAVKCYQQALALTPNDAEINHGLGYALAELGQFSKAVDYYQRARALAPNNAQIHKNLGNVFRIQGHFSQAIVAYQQALALNPNDADTYNNLGIVYSHMGQWSKALTCFQKALQLAPDSPGAQGNLANTLLYQGLIPQAIAHYQQILAKQPHALTYSNLLLALQYQADIDSTTLFLAHQQFNQQYGVPLAATIQPHLNTRHEQRQLRIGYISSDFRNHSVAYFIEPVLAQHDREQFEIVCYYSGTTTDKVTQRLQKLADQWINCADWSDEVLTEAIRQATVDILVDLGGHTNQNRLLVFARNPAPVQITYLGYPSTTGLTVIDYRITDNYVDPEDKADSLNSEQLLRMPHSYFCYRPDNDSPPVNPLPALKKKLITFGSFNNYAKLNSRILAIWAQVLQQVPTAKLLLKARSLNDPDTRQQLKQELTALGIDSGRLILTNYADSTVAHLKYYHQVDIALDSYPYNGATTTCEALWMGVPVVTLVGERHASRMGLSILSAVNLTELIADTPANYIEICVKLANDINYLQQLRASLRHKLATSPLLDGKNFTCHLEVAYRQAWQQWCRGTAINLSDY
jgi:protein O-GlcNAc transferase